MVLNEKRKKVLVDPRRLKKGACAPRHGMTLYKGILHINSLENYDNNPSPGIT